MWKYWSSNRNDHNINLKKEIKRKWKKLPHVIFSLYSATVNSSLLNHNICVDVSAFVSSRFSSFLSQSILSSSLHPAAGGEEEDSTEGSRVLQSLGGGKEFGFFLSLWIKDFEKLSVTECLCREGEGGRCAGGGRDQAPPPRCGLRVETARQKNWR